MENCLGIIVLQNLISVTQKNVVGIKFARISGCQHSTRISISEYVGATKVFAAPHVVI